MLVAFLSVIILNMLNNMRNKQDDDMETFPRKWLAFPFVYNVVSFRNI